MMLLTIFRPGDKYLTDGKCIKWLNHPELARIKYLENEESYELG